MTNSDLVFPELAETGSAPADGPIRIGSEEHKNLFCRTLLSTFNPYKPAVIDWPELTKDAQNRLTALPIWDIAVQMENRAGLNVSTFAETIDDPPLKKAAVLNTFEERRHRHVLSNLVEPYDSRLLQPTFIPSVLRFVRRFLKPKPSST
jgi:hypothetical protein